MFSNDETLLIIENEYSQKENIDNIISAIKSNYTSQSDKAIIKQLWQEFVNDHTFTLMSDNGSSIDPFNNSTATKVKVYNIKKLKLEFDGHI